MRVAIMGTGGLGGFFAGLLARAGNDVTCIARSAHLAAIREHGLTVHSPRAGDFTVTIAATDNPHEIGPVDLILFCVKTYDLEPAAHQLGPLLHAETVVVPVQNGLDAAEQIGDIVGAAHVLGGVSYVGGAIEAPGVVREGGVGRLLIGELDGGTSPRVERVLDTFRVAGLPAELHPNIRVAVWEKFLIICAFSGLAALTRLPLGPLRDCPDTAALLRGLIEETEAVARARAIPLPRDCVERALDSLHSIEPTRRPSLQQDLVAGRRLELEALNGALLRLGHACGVPTPLNFAIYAALKPFVDGPPILP